MKILVSQREPTANNNLEEDIRLFIEDYASEIRGNRWSTDMKTAQCVVRLAAGFSSDQILVVVVMCSFDGSTELLVQLIWTGCTGLTWWQQYLLFGFFLRSGDK